MAHARPLRQMQLARTSVIPVQYAVDMQNVSRLCKILVRSMPDKSLCCVRTEHSFDLLSQVCRRTPETHVI